MAAELLWHVQNCDLTWSLFFNKEPFELLQDLDYELIYLCETDPWDGKVLERMS